MKKEIINIFIDPDGTMQFEFGLMVLVLATTGVSYSTQCNGIATDEKSAEGFLVPVGDVNAAQPIMQWFKERFASIDPRTSPWTNERIASLAELVRRIPIWYRQGENYVRSFLELDQQRINECVEAWIPVITPFGKGYLLTANSD
jgi:hypothetical protein